MDFWLNWWCLHSLTLDHYFSLRVSDCFFVWRFFVRSRAWLGRWKALNQLKLRNHATDFLPVDISLATKELLTNEQKNKVLEDFLDPVNKSQLNTLKNTFQDSARWHCTLWPSAMFSRLFGSPPPEPRDSFGCKSLATDHVSWKAPITWGSDQGSQLRATLCLVLWN